MDEWVYNAPDIDGAKVIWAREMDEGKNRELIQYYKDRKVWLIQPDIQPAELTPYPLPVTNVAAAATEVNSTLKTDKKVQSGD
jgi:hypothetical protein